MTTTTTSAHLLIARLTRTEVSPRYDAQTRRMMRDERFALTAAVHSRDRARILAAMAEARRVAAMWHVTEAQ